MISAAASAVTLLAAAFGPTEPGGADPVTGWTGTPMQSGAYTIALTGASFCPPPNQPPDCAAAAASPSVLVAGLIGGSFANIAVTGVTDPDGDPVSITVDSITQDEPVCGLLDPCPDGMGVGTGTPQVRKQAILLGLIGNGRVYHIGFTADDGNGGACQGGVTVGVKPLISSPIPVDDAPPSYDSTDS